MNNNSSVINFVGKFASLQDYTLLEKLVDSFEYIFFREEFVESLCYPAVNFIESRYWLQFC